MRTYFLRVTKDQFSPVGDELVSPVFDLYENSTYLNYSFTKSGYGVSGLTTTWVGLRREDTGVWRDITNADLAAGWTGSFPTDTGRVADGRYIDHSARVDVVSYNVTGAPNLSLRVAVSDRSDAAYPDEWEAVGPFRTSDEIGIIDADRYVRFTLATLPDVDFEVLVRVEIDVPVMAPMYRSMRSLLDKFPEWMAIRELDNIGETPEIRQPQSIGGMFLNAMAGEWLDHIQSEMTYLDFQKYISTVDLDQMAWAYRSTPPDEIVWSIEGDGIPLARAADFYEFTLAQPEDHGAYWDNENNAVYTANEYTELTINGVAVDQQTHHVWNYLDEIGLIVDLRRIYGESNETFQARILDVYRNRGGVGVLNVKNAIRRELNLWKYDSIEPDSDYDGARPEILEISDIEKDPKYVDPDGMPTQAFVDLVEQLSRAHPTTWGRFVWDRAVWDPAGEDYVGYETLPYRMDGTPLPDQRVQSGVGDGDDLFVYPPDVTTGPKEFDARLKIRGREKTIRTEYPAVTFDFSIYGQGTRPVHDNPEKAVWFTAEITTTDAGNPTYVHPFQMRTTSNVSVDQPQPTEESFAIYELYDPDDTTTHREISFNSPITNAPYGGTGQIPVANIQTLRLVQGRWESGSYGFIDNSAEWEAWFSTQPTSVLRYNTAAPSVGNTTLPVVKMKSLLVANPVNAPWFSDKQTYRLTLNGQSPFTSPAPQDVAMPEIVWATFVDDKQIRIELETSEEGQGYGARTISEDGSGVFLPAEYLEVNADSTWITSLDADEIPRTYKLLSTATEEVTFSTATGASYPLQFTVWELFERLQSTPFSGVVDENGPWRNNTPPREGNTNYALTTASVSRSHFGLAHTTDFVVTWMGVEVIDEPRVLVWVDSNTVSPAVDDASEVEYPPSAIQEIEDNGIYYFEPFLVYARLRPNPTPEWYPHVHSGYFYDHNDEYYMFAKEQTASTTTAELVLDEPVRQGAPMIVRGVRADASLFDTRRVAFFDPEAEVVALTHLNRQRVRGSGTATLFLAYRDVYDVAVTDAETGAAVAADTQTATNQLTTTAVTDRDREYDVTYRVRNSYYVDNDYIATDGTVRSRIVFDQAPAGNGAVSYSVAYEGSDYDPARVIDLPLSPLYSVQHEGFIFISHNEYTLDSVRVHMSPNKLVADGEDYLLVSLFSLDRYGNPKPNQDFTLSTTFGSLDQTTVTTDHDGFAVVILTAAASTATLTGTLTVGGAVTASVDFEIEPESERLPRLLAVPQAEQIRSDGVSLNIVFGRLEDSSFQPISGATVTWKRARTIYGLFGPEAPEEEGTVTTNDKGEFVVGPFIAAEPELSGYWFLSCEATVDGDTTGDVVFWHEYPTSTFGVENFEGLPPQPINMEYDQVPAWAYDIAFPANYDESEPWADPNPVTVEWLPPTWYAIQKYMQYQLGLLGNQRGTIDYGYYVNRHQWLKSL